MRIGYSAIDFKLSVADNSIYLNDDLVTTIIKLSEFPCYQLTNSELGDYVFIIGDDNYRYPENNLCEAGCSYTYTETYKNKKISDITDIANNTYIFGYYNTYYFAYRTDDEFRVLPLAFNAEDMTTKLKEMHIYVSSMGAVRIAAFDKGTKAVIKLFKYESSLLNVATVVANTIIKKAILLDIEPNITNYVSVENQAVIDNLGTVAIQVADKPDASVCIAALTGFLSKTSGYNPNVSSLSTDAKTGSRKAKLVKNIKLEPKVLDLEALPLDKYLAKPAAEHYAYSLPSLLRQMFDDFEDVDFFESLDAKVVYRYYVVLSTFLGSQAQLCHATASDAINIAMTDLDELDLPLESKKELVAQHKQPAAYRLTRLVKGREYNTDKLIKSLFTREFPFPEAILFYLKTLIELPKTNSLQGFDIIQGKYSDIVQERLISAYGSAIPDTYVNDLFDRTKQFELSEGSSKANLPKEIPYAVSESVRDIVKFNIASLNAVGITKVSNVLRHMFKDALLAGYAFPVLCVKPFLRDLTDKDAVIRTHYGALCADVFSQEVKPATRAFMNAHICNAALVKAGKLQLSDFDPATAALIRASKPTKSYTNTYDDLTSNESCRIDLEDVSTYQQKALPFVKNYSYVSIQTPGNTEVGPLQSLPYMLINSGMAPLAEKLPRLLKQSLFTYQEKKGDAVLSIEYSVSYTVLCMLSLWQRCVIGSLYSSKESICHSDITHILGATSESGDLSKIYALLFGTQHLTRNSGEAVLASSTNLVWHGILSNTLPTMTYGFEQRSDTCLEFTVTPNVLGKNRHIKGYSDSSLNILLGEYSNKLLAPIMKRNHATLPDDSFAIIPAFYDNITEEFLREAKYATKGTIADMIEMSRSYNKDDIGLDYYYSYLLLQTTALGDYLTRRVGAILSVTEDNQSSEFVKAYLATYKQFVNYFYKSFAEKDLKRFTINILAAVAEIQKNIEAYTLDDLSKILEQTSITEHINTFTENLGIAGIYKDDDKSEEVLEDIEKGYSSAEQAKILAELADELKLQDLSDLDTGIDVDVKNCLNKSGSGLYELPPRFELDKMVSDMIDEAKAELAEKQSQSLFALDDAGLSADFDTEGYDDPFADLDMTVTYADPIADLLDNSDAVSNDLSQIVDMFNTPAVSDSDVSEEPPITNKEYIYDGRDPEKFKNILPVRQKIVTKTAIVLEQNGDFTVLGKDLKDLLDFCNANKALLCYDNDTMVLQVYASGLIYNVYYYKTQLRSLLRSIENKMITPRFFAGKELHFNDII